MDSVGQLGQRVVAGPIVERGLGLGPADVLADATAEVTHELNQHRIGLLGTVGEEFDDPVDLVAAQQRGDRRRTQP